MGNISFPASDMNNQSLSHSTSFNCNDQQAKVECSGPSRVNLVGGDNAASGNVYFMNGPVCDDNWDIDDGHVVCKELGFSSALEITKESYFGPVYRDFTTNN